MMKPRVPNIKSYENEENYDFSGQCIMILTFSFILDNKFNKE